MAKELAAAEKPMNGFEALTLAPIDRRLIDIALMTLDEIAWLDAYHLRVRTTLRGALDDATGSWLEAATRPLSG